MADTKNCEKCFYFMRIHGGMRCCHYIFIEGKKRPCEPGDGCTVKIAIKVSRKRKKGEAYA